MTYLLIGGYAVEYVDWSEAEAAVLPSTLVANGQELKQYDGSWESLHSTRVGTQGLPLRRVSRR